MRSAAEAAERHGTTAGDCVSPEVREAAGNLEAAPPAFCVGAGASPERADSYALLLKRRPAGKAGSVRRTERKNRKQRRLFLIQAGRNLPLQKSADLEKAMPLLIGIIAANHFNRKRKCI